MENVIRHIGRYSFIFLAVVFLDFPITKVWAQEVWNNNAEMSTVPVQKNVILKYIKASETDRFIFNFPDKDNISYEIKSDKDSTTVIFSQTFRLETLDLTSYDKAGLITQRKLHNHRLEIKFPQPLVSSIEHLNSLVLDLGSSHSISEQDADQKIIPLQISTLSFSWNTPVALSVFKRGKYLWIVFNQYQKINIEELEKSAKGIIKDILQMPHGNATILRLEAVDEVYSEVRREGLLWVIDLYNKKTDRHNLPIKVSTNTSIPEKPYIQVDLPHTEDVFSFLDPEVGDMLMAITSTETGYAFLEGYKYPDFQFLPTSQGMAVNSDDYEIGIIRNPKGFMLQTLKHPLHLSENLDQLKYSAALLANSNSVNLSQELMVPIIKKTFSASEKFLKSQISIAPDFDKDKFRIELARFYLSYGLASNALGILRKIQASELENNKVLSPRLISLLGVASFLQGRYDDAFDYFNNPDLISSPEIAVWRILSDTDNKQDLSFEIIKSFPLLQTYPAEIRKSLALSGISYALAKKNDTLAQNFLSMLNELPKGDENTAAAIEYYEAEKIRLQGYFRSALPKYKNVALSSSLKYSSLARFRIAEFNSQITSPSYAFTIKELEQMKFAWGEKNFKLNVLRKLVDLYLKTTNFYMTLKTLNNIALLAPEQKPAIEQRMIQIMEEIYYYNNDNDFNSIKALALFDDFGYLIKRSVYQTAIIIKFADRLVAVDLIDRAYNLLHQYLQDNRQTLAKGEISAIGSRLALIDMFRNDEDSALRNLSETDYDDISETLLLQRKIIEAKAYVMQGFPEKALALLGDYTSKNAILLKSEIYWNAQDWDKASDMLHLLIESPEKGKPLSEEQIRYILDWLTALKQAGKETVIVRIKNTFKPYFDNTAYSSIFNILTDNLESDTISIRDIDKTINNIHAFSDFTRQYMKSLMSQDLTETDASK